MNYQEFEAENRNTLLLLHGGGPSRMERYLCVCAAERKRIYKTIAKIGAAIVTVTVFLFAVCLAIDFTFGSYFVCMFLPLGYIMMAA